MFETLQHSALATAISNSLWLTAGLSAVHVVGFSLVSGGALVGNLRLLGVLFAERPLLEILAPTRRGMAVGLTLSVITGGLLFSARAMSASRNEFFQLKMLLLMAAAAAQYVVQRRAIANDEEGLALKASGLLGLALWIGVGLAGCAFILWE